MMQKKTTRKSPFQNRRKTSLKKQGTSSEKIRTRYSSKVTASPKSRIPALRRAEKALEESEARFKTLVEHIPAITYIAALDEFSTTLYVSPQVETILGFSQRDYKKDPDIWRKQLHPDDRTRIMDEVHKAHKFNKPFISEYRMLTSSGQVVWFRDEAVIVRDKDDKSLFLQGIMYDLTELMIHRNHLEELVEKRTNELKALNAQFRHSEEYFRLVTENALDIITILDSDGTIRYKSPSIEHVLGYKREDLIGRNIFEFIHPDDLPDVMNTFNYLVQNTISILFIQWRYRHKDNSWRIMEVMGKNLLDNPAVAGIVINSRDITERIVAEDELKRSNTDLQQFAYAASHDLQEPLRVIGGFVKLLAKRYKGKLDSQADEFIWHTVEGVKRMENLIKDLLAYSQIGTKDKDFKPSDCSLIIKEALANLRAAIEESHAKITCDVLPIVMADTSQLSRLFQNLIGNAIKFHGKKMPKIHVSAERKANDWVFSVKDNGIGIDPKDAGRIFIIFQRLHSREEYSGTGIGLAICKRIAERHSGRIWVESEPGNGSTFYFTIPVTN
jgi:PAS domain S-box-containing protein